MRYLSAFFLSALLCAQTPARVGIGATQAKLSLEEAVQMALKNNLEIEIEKTSQASALAAIRGARGFLDPILRLTPSGETRNTPTGSVLASSSGKLTEADDVAGVELSCRLREHAPVDEQPLHQPQSVYDAAGHLRVVATVVARPSD
jgi:hypothetical protein